MRVNPFRRGIQPLPYGFLSLPRDRVEKPVQGTLAPTESAVRRTRSRTFSRPREREEPTNVSEAVQKEKKDGCRGVQEIENQPETLVRKGSNETRGYPQAGIPLGIGKI